MKRAAFRAQIESIPLEKLVFLDECGFSLNLYRLYGWTIGGGRCEARIPFNKGKNLSVAGAFSLPFAGNPNGVLALWSKLEAWNGVLFECFVEEAVLPKVAPGSVLVLDNARIHHSPTLKAAVEKAGCFLLYLPPYSPDFNPIELLWSWLKDYVRTVAPRDNQSREEAVYAAKAALPPQHAQKWFAHCALL